MQDNGTFRIISVTGAHSSVGKTTLCSILLKRLKGFGAIKFTKTDLYTSVIDDTETIMQKDKDTALMSSSGAEKVIWIKSPYSGLEDALHIAMNKIGDLKGVIVEGNSPVDFLNPHLVIFIVGDAGQMKPSAVKVIKKADIIVINSEKKPESPPFSAPLSFNISDIFWIDLIHEKGETEQFIDCVNKKLAQNS